MIQYEAAYKRRKQARVGAIVLGAIGVVLCLIGGLKLGAVPISWDGLMKVLTGLGDPSDSLIINYIRLPRLICALLVGMNLALAGCILQGVLQNPLVDPGIIGVTAGAAVAAMAIMIIVPQFSFLIPLGAFIGALLALLLVFTLAWEKGIHPLRLILAGVAVAAFFGGGTMALSVMYPDKIQGTVNWMAGGFAGAKWEFVYMILPYSIVGILGGLLSYRKLNALQMGDEVAIGLGLNLQRTRFELIIIAALLSASAVSVAGLLSFVGLIVPHVMRLIVGSDFKFLLPSSAIVGAVFVMAADTLARSAFAPSDIPVGIFLSFLGAPFFLYLLKRGKRG